MPINVIIQQKRKELGYTQEQVANYLGVSTPAVNKWEKGSTNPDIALLAPLARLLKTDINTLLCFNEELTEQEIMVILQEINDITKQSGLEKGFELAKSKMQEYPKCELLTYRLATLMEGIMMMEGKYGVALQEYKEQIRNWYESCISSKIDEVRNGALYLLASKAINDKAFDRAKEYVEQLPEVSELDKNILQANLLLGLDKPDEAAKLLEKRLRMSLMHFQTHILKLLDAVIQARKLERAKQIAELWSQIASLIGEWRYNSYIGEFQIAIETKDEKESIRLLSLMLESLKDKVTWECPLFERLNETKVEMTYEAFLPGIINDLKNNPQYDFLREKEAFNKLIKEYDIVSDNS